MNTLSEDQYMRAEKMKKQEMYRNMLDQQVRLNEFKRQNQVQNLRHPFTDGRFIPQPRHSVQYPPEENKYLPPLQYQPTKQNNWSSNRNTYGRSHTEEDKSELYLNNCEEIIRNLRELKGKKKQWENYGSHPQYNAKKQSQRDKYQNHQIQYYPKHSYFASSGSAYNKSVAIEPTPKQFKAHSTRLNTLEEPKQSNEKSAKKDSTSKNLRNKKYLDKLVIPTAETEGKSNSGSKKSEKHEESLQSESPSGIKQEQKMPKKTSKVRHKLFKLTTPKEKEESRVRGEPFESQQNQQSSEIKQQDKKNQSNLTACLIELTKYLKNLNERQEKPKQNPLQQPTANDPQKEAQKSQIDPSQNAQDKRLQTHQKQPQQSQLSLLKNRVIEALKNVSKKSHRLYLRMSDRTTTKSPQYLKVNQTANRDQEVIQPKKRKSQTEQLALMLATHLDKHDDNSEELNRCLKELHQYLKNQNDEIKELKSYRDTQMMNQTSRQGRKSRVQKESSPPKESLPAQRKDQPSRSQSPVQIQKGPSRSQSPIQARNSPASQKRKQLKLQEAVLKSLKKARLRGNKFKERVENFKKAHQPPQTKQNPQQPPKEQQNNGAAKQPLKQDEPLQNPVELQPAENKPQITNNNKSEAIVEKSNEPEKQGP